MRRLVFVTLALLALLVGVAAPAQANHGDGSFPSNPTDLGEQRLGSDSTSWVEWRIGNTTMRPCVVKVKNERSAAHSVYIEVRKRETSDTLLKSVTFSSVGAGVTAFYYPQMSLYPIGNELYVRWKFGDGYLGWKTLDPFVLSGADVNTYNPPGTFYCP